MHRTIKGHFDEYGFPYLNIRVLNEKQDLSAAVKAIIDTGAAHCLVRETLASQLQLETLRIADYRHPVFGKMPIQEYIMDVCFNGDCHDGTGLMEGIRAGTLVDLNYPAEVIIGVELLRHCRFEYDGYNKTFQLTIDK